jgi:type II secretory pathway component GspD/PulD (secretin)
MAAQNAAVTTQGGRTAAVVTRFQGANAIVIAAPADIQRQLTEVIRQLDTRREQVLIEAIVAEDEAKRRAETRKPPADSNPRESNASSE